MLLLLSLEITYLSRDHGCGYCIDIETTIDNHRTDKQVRKLCSKEEEVGLSDL